MKSDNILVRPPKNSGIKLMEAIVPDRSRRSVVLLIPKPMQNPLRTI